MARRYEFCLRVFFAARKKNSYLQAAVQRSFLLYRQKDIDDIIDFYSPKRKTPTNFEGKLPKLCHR